MSDETLFEPDSSIDYTFMSMASGDRSTLDHFLLSHNFNTRVLRYDVIHDGDNLSDHDPVCIWLDIDLTYCQPSHNIIDSKPPKLCWRKARISSISAYQEQLRQSLRTLLILLMPSSAVTICVLNILILFLNIVRILKFV